VVEGGEEDGEDDKDDRDERKNKQWCASQLGGGSGRISGDRAGPEPGGEGEPGPVDEEEDENNSQDHRSE